jgi:hypothetical protein
MVGRLGVNICENIQLDPEPCYRCYHFHKESPKKKMAGIAEPMVPTYGGLANIDPWSILYKNRS